MNAFSVTRLVSDQCFGQQNNNSATMFLLSRIQDSVQVQPQDLGKTPVEAIRVELEASYYDKVLPDIGLAGK